jgi:hypothetical protein
MEGTTPMRSAVGLIGALQKEAWGVEWRHYGSNMVKKPLICPIRRWPIRESIRALGATIFFIPQRN